MSEQAQDASPVFSIEKIYIKDLSDRKSVV